MIGSRELLPPDGLSTIAQLVERHSHGRTVVVVDLRTNAPVLRRDWGIVAGPESALAIVAIPMGSGSGGTKNIIRAVAMIALIVVSSAVAGPVAGSLSTMLGFTISTQLVAAAVFVGGSMLINALLPPEKAKLQDAEQSPTYSLTAQGNNARLYSPVPRIYGNMKVYPDFATAPFTLFMNNRQILYQLLCVGLGPMQIDKVLIEDTELYDRVTGMSGAFAGTRLQIVQPGNRVTLMPSRVETSIEVGGLELDEMDLWLGGYSAVSADALTNRIEVDVMLPSGLFHADNKGKNQPQSVSFRVEAQPIDASGSPTGDYVLLGEHTITRSSAVPWRQTFSYDVGENRYLVRAKRTSPKSTSSRTADSLQWVALRAYVPHNGVFPDCTVIALQLAAGSSISGQSSRKVAVVASALIRPWTGTALGSLTTTRSIAWALLDMCHSASYGGGFALSKIDTAALTALDATWTSRGDTFDGVFDTKQTFWDALRQVARAGRARPVLIGDVITFIRDEPRTVPRALLTPRNIVQGSLEMQWELQTPDSADDVIVRFMNRSTWQSDEVRCALPGSPGKNPATLDLIGVTTRVQAWREGMYEAAVQRYRRTFMSLETEMEGRLLMPLDPVVVSHDVMDWLWAGELAESNGETLRVQPEHGLSTGTSTNVVVSTALGRALGPVMATVLSNDELQLDHDSLLASQIACGVTLSQAIARLPGAEAPRVALGNATEMQRRMRVVSGQPRQSGERVRLLLVRDAPEVHTVDTTVPPAERPIPPSSGLPPISSLVVTVDPNSSPLQAHASWSGVAGAQAYVLQTSSDGIYFEERYEGPLTTASFPIEPGVLTARVAVVMSSLVGVWLTKTYTFGSASVLPGQIENLSSTYSVLTAILSVSLQPVARADNWDVVVSVESAPGSGVYDVIALQTLGTTLTALYWFEEDIEQAGGPWPSYKVTVTAQNSVGTSTASWTSAAIGLDSTTVTLSAPYTGADLDVQWASISGATTYDLELYSDASLSLGSQITVRSGTIPKDFISASSLFGLGGPYDPIWARARGRNQSLSGAYSPALLVVDSRPLATPTNGSWSGTIQIAWTAPTDYRMDTTNIYRDRGATKPSVPLAQVATASGQTLSWTDPAPRAGFWKYWIEAQAKSGTESAPLIVQSAAGCLDVTSIASPIGAWGAVRLRTAHSGPLLRVRRASDNLEIDVSADDNGHVNASTIASHCGSSAGYVTKLYCQVAGGPDLVQATASRQMQIWSGTALRMLSGVPALYAEDALRGYSAALGTYTGSTLSAAVSLSWSSSSSLAWRACSFTKGTGIDTATGSTAILRAGTATTIAAQRNGTILSGVSLGGEGPESHKTMVATFSGSLYSACDGDETDTVTSTGTFDVDTFNVFAAGSNSMFSPALGYLVSTIAWVTSLSSADMLAMQSALHDNSTMS